MLLVQHVRLARVLNHPSQSIILEHQHVTLHFKLSLFLFPTVTFDDSCTRDDSCMFGQCFSTSGKQYPVTVFRLILYLYYRALYRRHSQTHHCLFFNPMHIIYVTFVYSTIRNRLLLCYADQRIHY